MCVHSIDDLSESRLKQLWSTRTKPKIVEPPPELPREDGSELISSDQSDTLELTDDADFNEEAFVRAAAAFREGKYHGILELLTEAITSGRHRHYCVLYCVDSVGAPIHDAIVAVSTTVHECTDNNGPTKPHNSIVAVIIYTYFPIQVIQCL